MLRILPPLLIATICHLLLFTLPLPHPTIQAQLTGEKGIKIHLQTQQKKPPQPSTPIQPEPTIPVVRTKASEPPHVIKTIAPVHLQKKTLKKRFPVTAVPTASPETKEPTRNESKNNLPQAAIIHAAPLHQQNLKPEYPALARRRNWQGTVILSVTVSIEGKGQSIRIHSSSGHTILDTSALKTVNTWHFRPGTKNDKPVVMEVLVPVHFRLDN